VTANLLRDGAVFLGKANLDEFAMGSSNMTSAFGPVENPVEARGGSGREFWCRAALPAARRRRSRRAWPWAHRHGYRRLHPPAGVVLRHCGHQADLWAVLALGRGRVRLLAGPGRAVFAHVEDCAILLGDGGVRSEGQHQRRPPGAGFPAAPLRGCRACASACRGIPHGRDECEIERSGSRGWTWLREAGCRNRRCFAAAHEIRPAGVLHRGARPRLPRIWRAMMACGSARGWMART
jgi:aspartyl-tRNA(Asn)/glutamyl-tRNA(Gln) amidotransferase subunit A